MRSRLYAAAVGALLCGVALAASAGHAAPEGERIYRSGHLANGEPLSGGRPSGTEVGGTAAACVNCHRRSGLGTIEGSTIAPPIIAKYLYRSRATNVGDLTLPHVPGFTPNAWTYDDASLARVIRTGVRPDGTSLSPLMPRYALDDVSMAQLLSYLRALDSEPVPGVSDTTLQFATIITPDADPVEKQAMLTVLERFFDLQRHVIAAETRPLQTSREIKYRVTRQWRLHVWQLHGAPDTWERQLEGFLAVEPVFAVISGLGRAEWRPIHRFCERNAVPCLLPNIDLPVVAEDDFYPVYFSRGVLLEADMIAATLESTTPRPARLVEVFRADDAGATAAAALAERAQSLGVRTSLRSLPATHPGEVADASLGRALRDVAADDAVVLWLRPGDIAALRGAPVAGAIYASGLMAGLESAPLPAAWRSRTHLTYPADPPELRRVRMNFPLGWFKMQGIPVTAERIQTDTYLACVVLSETLGHMLDSFVREFLIERMEMMLSLRLVNGYFPRLGLAPGQRFASKGGYLVHLLAGANAVALDSEWMTP